MFQESEDAEERLAELRAEETPSTQIVSST